MTRSTERRVGMRRQLEQPLKHVSLPGWNRCQLQLTRAAAGGQPDAQKEDLVLAFPSTATLEHTVDRRDEPVDGIAVIGPGGGR